MTSVFKITNDQKEVLLKKISELIERYGTQSLLDIGAGQSFLALQLSQKVEKYLAIESTPKSAQKLRDANVQVIEGTFPEVDIQGTYDLVLASHSIPERVELYQSFFTKAWSHVALGGLLLVITFKGVKDELFVLTKRLRESCSDDDTLKYEAMIKILSTLGKIKMEKIVSCSGADNIEDMTNFLTFSIGGTWSEKVAYRPELKRIIEEKYKSGTQYIFPHTHLVFSVKKN